MRFSFSSEQRLFQESFHEFLAKECTSERITSLWQTETGRSPALWSQLAELGVLGLLVPERFGGMGLCEVDLVLLLEESGRAALPEPLVETAAVAVPALAELEDETLAGHWLPRAAAGDAVLTVASPVNPFVTDAHLADLLLLVHEGELHAVERANTKLTHQPTGDGSTRLFRVDWEPTSASCVARGADARAALDRALDRGALGCAAQLVGVAQTLVDKAVAYAKEREQFGVPIGSFQAVKHPLASVQVAIEFARPVVYRAAYSVAHAAATRSVDVSQAKHMATRAALQAAKTSLQVHGAIGYTFEQDVHVWMKRAWTLADAWGTDAFHRRRAADAVIDGAHPYGPRGPA